MFKKILLRSVVGATAVGSALGVSLVATPAVVTSAPEIRTVACATYPGSVSTTTDLSVRPAVAAYGTSAKATAKVSSGSGTPWGSVRFVLTKPDGKVRWDVSLSRGVAAVSLPRTLSAGHTYPVTARYMPTECSRFAGSSDGAYYTVKKSPASTRVNAPNVRRTQSARVNVAVGSSTVAPTGQVRIVVKRRGRVVASKVRTLSGGKASASFGRIRVGSYDVRAVYRGTINFGSSAGSDEFRVRR